MDELCGIHLANLLERENPDEVDPERIQNLETLLDGGQQTWHSLRSDQCQWMAIEGQYCPLGNPQSSGADCQIR
jgi:hypothetical protein